MKIIDFFQGIFFSTVVLFAVSRMSGFSTEFMGHEVGILPDPIDVPKQKFIPIRTRSKKWKIRRF